MPSTTTYRRGQVVVVNQQPTALIDREFVAQAFLPVLNLDS